MNFIMYIICGVAIGLFIENIIDKKLRKIAKKRIKELEDKISQNTKKLLFLYNELDINEEKLRKIKKAIKTLDNDSWNRRGREIILNKIGDIDENR